MMTWQKDAYEILGVSSDSSVQDIKSAYRQIARRIHPDVNPNNEAAALQFQDVTQAHEILTDQSRRQAYDQARQSRLSAQQYTCEMHMISSRQLVASLGEPQVVYLLVNLQPDERARNEIQQNNARVNLALVLDQSNSMNGIRIEKVKVAAQQIIENLRETDFISVVAFDDRPDTLIEATPVKDKLSLKARVSMLEASRSTEIYKGLSEGIRQCRRYMGPRLVNHVVLLTDGHTYGDEERTLKLAEQVANEGIGISAMGLGHDWNDRFLDTIAGRTGGTSEYINSVGAVVRFLNDHVRGLANAFAERINLAIAVDPDVVLESAFKIAPNPQPLSIDNSVIPLGNLQADRRMSVLLQLQLPSNMRPGPRSIARISVSGDILNNKDSEFTLVSEAKIDVSEEASVYDETPNVILDALSKLTLYQLQEKAQDALDNGNPNEATRRLENLATRLLSMGQEELANEASAEARRVSHTHKLSSRGQKTLKYQTRHLLLDASTEE
jgi:Ca-activated chloride channel homolog